MIKKLWFATDKECFSIFFFGALFLASLQVAAVTIDEQRKDYLEARKALKTGNLKLFNKLTNSLETYPLYPYLSYYQLSQQLHKVDPVEIKNFISDYPDFVFTDKLRSSWLRQLARQKKWPLFLDNYTHTDNIKLRCYQLQARIETDNQIRLLEDTVMIWLAGESLPSACDPVFALLYKSDLMTNQLVWQRIKLSVENNEIGLVRYLNQYLDEKYEIWGRRWLAMHKNPATQIKNAQYEDTAMARDIVLYGIKRLAKVNLNRALKYWPILQDNYSFSSMERDEVDFYITLRALKTKHPKASVLLNNLDADIHKEELFYWRLRLALKDKDWHKLYQWTSGSLPYQEQMRYRWIYWHARALEGIGDIEKAKQFYELIADQRDYYGFLAADRLGIAYTMQFHPLLRDIETENRLMQLPSMRRVKELFILYSDYRAKREWQHVLKYMNSYEQQIAASIVYKWGWYDTTIFTMTIAKAFDDLNLRFPVLYGNTIKKYALERDLAPSWIYALIRAESAFKENAKSLAGALGLMQVMPATGRAVAKKIGLKSFHPNVLLVASKNIEIGTAYMQEMLDKFDNHILATASYNAGYNNIIRWMPKTTCQDADIWVELIPFSETRAYVKRVMFYASIYDRQLQRKVVRLKQRMATIYPFSTVPREPSTYATLCN